MICRLCGSAAELFYKDGRYNPRSDYYSCSCCGAVFMDPDYMPGPEEEKKRYLTHNNDINDPAYQGFVSPIVEAVTSLYSCASPGLDFGAGPGPVAADMLAKQGYSIELYDPFFWNYPASLEKKYDYIICCEVIEHFHFPAREFALLRSLLKPGGTLFCMTVLYSENTDFRSWHYRNDITHVFFYRSSTIEWIRKKYEFSSALIKDRLISFYTDKPAG